jgi:AraC family transcriptional regulator
MSLSGNRTSELWRGFMTEKNKIANTVGADLYSVGVYDPDYFKHFYPNSEFEKWAAVEVSDLDKIPANMQALVIPPGIYAVFLYKGHPKDGAAFFQYIFGTWLPSSDCLLDARPHFEIIGEKYNNDSSDSEEEIWIPVIRKNLI